MRVLVVSRDKKKGKITSWPCSRWTQNLSSCSAPQLPPPSPRPCSETFPSQFWLAPGALGRLALICWHALSAQPLQQGSARDGLQLLRQTPQLFQLLVFDEIRLAFSSSFADLKSKAISLDFFYSCMLNLCNIFDKTCMCAQGGTIFRDFSEQPFCPSLNCGCMSRNWILLRLQGALGHYVRYKTIFSFQNSENIAFSLSLYFLQLVEQPPGFM